MHYLVGHCYGYALYIDAPPPHQPQPDFPEPPDPTRPGRIPEVPDEPPIELPQSISEELPGNQKIHTEIKRELSSKI